MEDILRFTEILVDMSFEGIHLFGLIHFRIVGRFSAFTQINEFLHIVIIRVQLQRTFKSLLCLFQLIHIIISIPQTIEPKCVFIFFLHSKKAINSLEILFLIIISACQKPY